MGKLPLATTITAALLASACVHQTETPPLAGPSEFAQSVTVTATPDQLSLDGSRSTIGVFVAGPTGAPMANVVMRLDIAVGNVFADCGQLNQRTIVTGTDGRASTVFTAPIMPLPLPECTGFLPGDTVSVQATPVGTNALDTFVRHFANIRMFAPIVIPAPGGPTVNFTMTPSTAHVNEDVTFNASTSTAAPGRSLVSFTWTFGDGVTKTGAVVTHDFGAAGGYNVVVTVTDDIGQQALKSALLTIIP